MLLKPQLDSVLRLLRTLPASRLAPSGSQRPHVGLQGPTTHASAVSLTLHHDSPCSLCSRRPSTWQACSCLRAFALAPPLLPPHVSFSFPFFKSLLRYHPVSEGFSLRVAHPDSVLSSPRCFIFLHSSNDHVTHYINYFFFFGLLS